MIEVKVLDMLRRRDTDDSHNVVHLKEYFVFRNHLCITFELMSINLYELIKQNNFEVRPSVPLSFVDVDVTGSQSRSDPKVCDSDPPLSEIPQGA